MFYSMKHHEKIPGIRNCHTLMYYQVQSTESTWHSRSRRKWLEKTEMEDYGGGDWSWISVGQLAIPRRNAQIHKTLRTITECGKMCVKKVDPQWLMSFSPGNMGISLWELPRHPLHLGIRTKNAGKRAKAGVRGQIPPHA